MISADVTVARLLDEHPALLDVLVRHQPHFAHLRERLLRKVIAPTVTVADAARMAGIGADELVAALRAAAGETAAPPPGVSPAPRRAATSERAATPRPPALEAVPESRRVTVDVRDDIRRGVEPFGRIMAAAARLGDEDVLVLRAPFEPVPLYTILGKRGFAHFTERHAADDVSVWFYRDARPAAASAPPVGARSPVVLDVRDLEPPQPMVRVLEELDTLGTEELVVVHHRRPMFLYPLLEERGFRHETDDSEPGVVRIHIHRAPDGGQAR